MQDQWIVNTVVLRKYLDGMINLWTMLAGLDTV